MSTKNVAFKFYTDTSKKTSIETFNGLTIAPSFANDSTKGERILTNNVN